MCGTGKGTALKASRNRSESSPVRILWQAPSFLSLKMLNLKCPQDIGVVGFNDISLSKNFSPALTTVRLPSAEMGKTGGRSVDSSDQKQLRIKTADPSPCRIKSTGVHSKNPIKTIQNAKSAVSFPLPGNRTFSFYIFHRRNEPKWQNRFSVLPFFNQLSI